MRTRDKRTRLMSELLANIKRYAVCSGPHVSYMNPSLASSYMPGSSVSWGKFWIRVTTRKWKCWGRLASLRSVPLFVLLLAVKLSSGMQHCFMEWYSFTCCIQFLCHCCSDIVKTTDVGHHLPRYRIIHAVAVSACNGAWNVDCYRLAYFQLQTRSVRLRPTSLRRLYRFSACLCSYKRMNCNQTLGK